LSKIEQIHSNMYCIDCHDLQTINRTGCYVLKGDKTTLIETSASPSIPFILDGLKELHIHLEDVEYVIVTHIHLDHAGGAGLLLEKCPNARLVVHPKGARHLEDPSRLIAGAKAVYGEKFNQLFDPIVPIPKERIIIMNHQDQLQLENRTLTFYDTPGHANHHFSFLDSLTNGMFVGDTAGIYYRELEGENFPFILPSTSPSQFRPDAMLQAIDLYEELNPSSLYFGHYGQHKQPEEVYMQLKYWLPIFVKCGEEAMQTYQSQEEQIKATTASLTKICEQYLLAFGIEKDHPIFNILSLDLNVSAMGIIDYLTKKAKTN